MENFVAVHDSPTFVLSVLNKEILFSQVIIKHFLKAKSQLIIKHLK